MECAWGEGVKPGGGVRTSINLCYVNNSAHSTGYKFWQLTLFGHFTATRRTKRSHIVSTEVNERTKRDLLIPSHSTT
ncbi:hypothetical protein DPEC_G00059500 [Dallia pectoralis]|uniref:Uncharacterized protein n=1 Tax=Dallia pectoralis TaxID=75939 RepID=A0ACC2H6G4_DALPE|nr:hypothetical protein DPEC_G00059500 [Dallia pectoralis]